MDLASLKFARSHEWLHLAGDVATIGISDFAVKELTDLVLITLPKVGARITAGKTFGEVESVKAVSDLYAPVSGTVTEVNSKLLHDLQPLSDDPYGAGWLIRVKVDAPAAVEGLMSRTDYDAFCESEAH